jgi:para-nitrobenzyl esterase
MTSEPSAETRQGAIRGQAQDGFTVFRGIPFAAPPTGALRWAPPQPPASWSGVREATADGPIAPQNPSRLALVMGDFTAAQSEDCLTLTVWRPDPAPPAPPMLKVPVLVWIHGGAFLTGAGALPWYAGDAYARSGLVVVALNYRLGALGFLSAPGLSSGNLGLLDQIAALRWVQANIAAFGGDPDTVTVMGQSAGGGSIGALMAMPAARGLFKRAIMQSPALRRVNPSPEDAAQAGVEFLAILGVPAAQPALAREVPVARILQAQSELIRRRYGFADPGHPFRPVIDPQVLPRTPVAAARAGELAGIDILTGTTREEMAAFYSVDARVRDADEATIAAEFERLFAERGPAVLAAYRRARLATRPATALADLYTDWLFALPCLELAEAQAGHGRPAWVYQFDWQSPGGFEACHCLDLPFVFDNLDDWTNAPMLDGADRGAVAQLARIMQRAWAAFALTGNPDHDGLPHWERYDLARRTTMRFDAVIGPVGDLAGRTTARLRPAAPPVAGA